MNNKPEKLNTFMYFLIKEASKYSLTEFFEDIDISQEELEEIQEWFQKELDINFWNHK